MEFKSVNKILVIKLRYIGDVILSVPVFTALKNRFPDAHVTVLVNAGTEEVLRGNPNIDEIITLDRSVKRLGLLKRAASELRFLKAIRSKSFDMAVDLSSIDRSAIIALASGARYRLALDPMGDGFPGKKKVYTHLTELKEREHMVLRNLGVVRQCGIDTDDLSVKLYVRDKYMDEAERFLGAMGVAKRDFLVVVQPTSRRDFKCWPEAFFARLIDALHEKGAKVIVTGSSEKDEVEWVERIASCCKRKPLVLNTPTIMQLAAAIKKADLFIGLDSAPMHIAAAVGTPVIAIFGPIRAYNWAPWYEEEPFGYDKVSGVQKSGPHVVVQKDWDCVPCFQEGCDGTHVSRCIEETEVGEIMEHVHIDKTAAEKN